MKEICDDCPDRDACFQGMSCDLSRRFAAAASLYQQRMKGNTTMSAKTPAEKNTPATVEDVVAKAAEEKLVTVPQQETRTPEEVAADAVDEIFENGKDNKKSLKDRVADAKAKLSEHRKLVVAVGIAVVVASVSAYKQAAKKKAESEMLEEEIVPVETEPFVDETLESDSEPAV